MTAKISPKNRALVHELGAVNAKIADLNKQLFEYSEFELSPDLATRLLLSDILCGLGFRESFRQETKRTIALYIKKKHSKKLLSENVARHILTRISIVNLLVKQTDLYGKIAESFLDRTDADKPCPSVYSWRGVASRIYPMEREEKLVDLLDIIEFCAKLGLMNFPLRNAYNNLLSELMRDGPENPKLVVDHYEKLRKLGLELPKLSIMYAIALVQGLFYSRLDYRRAILVLDRALGRKLAPEDRLELLKTKLFLLDRYREPSKALKLIKLFRKKKMNLPDIERIEQDQYYVLIKTNMSENDYVAGLKNISLMRKALLSKNNRHEVRIQTWEAVCLKELGKTKESLEAFNKLIASNRLDLDFLKTAAVAFYNAEQYTQSLRLLKRAELGNVSDAEIYRLIGNIYLIKNNLQLAVQYYDRAIALNSDEISLMNKIVTLNRLGRELESRRILEKVLSTNPKQSWPYIFLGNLYFGNKNYKKALGYYTRAHEKEETAECLASIAITYYNLRDYNRAIQYCNRVLALDDKHTGALFLKGLALATYPEERYSEALIYFKRAEKIEPGLDMVTEAIGMTLQNIRQIKLTAKHLRRNLLRGSSSSDYSLLHTLSKIYIGLNKYKVALGYVNKLDKVSSNKDQKIEALQIKYRILRRLGRDKEAQKVAKQLKTSVPFLMSLFSINKEPKKYET